MTVPRSPAGFIAAGLMLALLMPGPAMAKPQEVRVRSQSKLSFGTFMVFGQGSRAISATGAVVDRAIVTLDGSQPRPARFTIEYDRGNESRQTLEVTIELVLTTPGNMRFGGVDARLSALETDVPGHVQVAPG